MTDITKARKLFHEAGLAFPTVPEDLAPQLKERDRWVFSTRPIDTWPYDLDYYVHEVQRKQVSDYALLSHSGHGVNSYAIQYYVVHGSLHMFLHLGWGGVYTDNEEDVATIRACFLKADQIVQAMVQGAAVFKAGGHLTVVASDFYGSYWSPPGASRRRKRVRPKDVSPPETLTEVLDWLTSKSLHPSSLGISISNMVVTKENVEKALDEIDRGGSRGVPRNRNSTKYCLETRGRHYPPKYVLLRAHRIQTGTKLEGFGGGPRTNIQLQNLGYVILEHGCGNTCNFSD